MTAPSPTSTDNPASSPHGSENGAPSPMPENENAPAPASAAPDSPDALANPADESGNNEGSSPESAVLPPELQPRDLWIDELHSLTVQELHERMEQLKVRINPEKTRHYLVCDLLRAYHSLGFRLLAEGITEFIT